MKFESACGPMQMEEPSTVDAILVRAAERWPDLPFLIFGSDRYTFGDVAALVDRTARGFLELGVRPGDRVALWMSNRPEWVVSQFAATRLGAILVPLNTRLRRDDLAHTLQDCGAKVIVTQGNSAGFSYVGLLRQVVDAEVCPELDKVVVVGPGGVDLPSPMIDWSAFQKIGADSILWPSPETQPSKPAYILYTSGTTSLPKGAMLSHANLNNAFNIAGDLREGDSVFLAYPLFAVTGCHNSVLACAIAGASLVLSERFSGHEAVALIEQHKCTVYNGIIDTLKEVAAAPNFREERVRTLRHANVFPRSPEHAPLFRRFGFATAGTGFGLTETSGPVTHSTDAIEAIKPGQGKPWTGNALRIVGADQEEVEPGEIGEILIRSRQVMLGYFNKPEETRLAITPEGWLRTKDIGYLTADGGLVWIGRSDDVYKTSGFNVSGLEVESFLAAHPKLAEVAVVGVPDSKKGAVGAAFVVPNPHQEITLAEIEEFCRGRIASHKIPVHLVITASFPRTTSGKVRKLELRDRHFGAANAEVLGCYSAGAKF